MSDIATAKQFLAFDERTAALLQEFWTHLEPELPTVLNRFYENLANFSELSDMIRNEGAEIDTLKNAQSIHWRSLFNNAFDDAHLEANRRIGLTHARIGLTTDWYMMGYANALTDMLGVAARKYGRDATKMSAVSSAVTKAVVLDMQLAVQTYFDETKAMYQRRLEELASDFQNTVGATADMVLTSSQQIGHQAQSTAQRQDTGSEHSVGVAKTTESVLNQVQSMAAATEELSASLTEVSRQVQRSSEVAAQAVQDADRADTQIKQLAEAADSIGNVVDLINQIAGQTNLLALNATIEAARAGDAGKGFAVVANEVKTLANQTAKATEEIKGQIDRIQSEMRGTEEAIGSIRSVIEEMNESAGAISGTVEEQRQATQEIAESSASVSQGMGSVAEGVSEITANSFASCASVIEMMWTADDLVGPSQELQTNVQDFIQRIREG
jgi:methyl-accepting chemotaxis protein